MSAVHLLPQPLHPYRLREGPEADVREAPNVDPGNLLGSGFHELVGAGTGAETTVLAFALSAMASVTARADQKLCICSLAADAQEYGVLYGQGFRSLGFSPDRLLMISAEKEKHLLWALEEALAARAFGAVIGTLGATERLYGFAESRRLKLRTMQTGTPLYLLRHHSRGGATAAHGRWRVATAPSRASGAHAGFELPGAARLRLTLEKLNGRPPQQWEMDYDVARGFRMAAVLPDRADRAADERRRQAL